MRKRDRALGENQKISMSISLDADTGRQSVHNQCAIGNYRERAHEQKRKRPHTNKRETNHTNRRETDHTSTRERAHKQ